MASAHLQNIPQDVLQYIALLSTSSRVLDPPSDVIPLLLTSRSMYRCLSLQACPHLYASIFRANFDLAAARRRFHYSELTDSCLAGELVQRCRVLQRVRRRDITTEGIRQDLWTIWWMISESDGLNEAQLFAAGLSDFLVAFVLENLCGDNVNVGDKFLAHAKEVRALASWLLCLTLSRWQISNMPAPIRDSILGFLRPFTRSTVRDSAINLPALPFSRATMRSITGSEESSLHSLRCDVVQYHRRRTITCPNPAAAAILLTFALKDAVPLQIPPNLPESRAVATATQRSGPTMEDYRIVNTIRTPLFSDTWSYTHLSHDAGVPQDPHRSLQYDQYFYRMVLEPPIVQSKLEEYIPGSLTATWEGTYMISPLVLSNVTEPSSSSDAQDFICRRPIQCALREYFRSSHIPSGDTKDVERASSLTPVSSHRGGDEQLGLASHHYHRGDPSQALDVVIEGETLHEHEQAWGSYKYSGRVQTEDGLILLKREAKDESQGIWTFEGCLWAEGTVFIGRWWSGTPSDQCSMHGIFCMRKSTQSNDEST